MWFLWWIQLGNLLVNSVWSADRGELVPSQLTGPVIAAIDGVERQSTRIKERIQRIQGWVEQGQGLQTPVALEPIQTEMVWMNQEVDGLIQRIQVLQQRWGEMEGGGSSGG